MANEPVKLEVNGKEVPADFVVMNDKHQFYDMGDYFGSLENATLEKYPLDAIENHTMLLEEDPEGLTAVAVYNKDGKRQLTDFAYQVQDGKLTPMSLLDGPDIEHATAPEATVTELLHKERVPENVSADIQRGMDEVHKMVEDAMDKVESGVREFRDTNENPNVDVSGVRESFKPDFETQNGKVTGSPDKGSKPNKAPDSGSIDLSGLGDEDGLSK